MQTEIDFTKPIFHIENNAESQLFFDANKDRFSKQCKIVFEAMLKGERLTTKVALLKYNIGDLRRRCKDLRDMWNVDVKAEWNDERFKEYYL